MRRRTVVLDACVLVPIRLATTLLWLAEAGLFEPLWSDTILEEVERALPKVGVLPERARHRVATMREAFGAAALVDDFDHLIERLSCDPKDRHVLAAAIRAEADTIVTFNVRDFPPESVAQHGIEVIHPDQFLEELLAQRAITVLDVLQREVEGLRQPRMSMAEFLAGLTLTAPGFANLAGIRFGESGGPGFGS